MKIGIIAHLKHAIGEPFAGGLEMHTHMLARALRTRGHDITVFAGSASDPEIGLEAIYDEPTLERVGVAEASDVTFFREHHAYLGLMNRLRTASFDIIHNNSLHYLPVAMADALPMPIVTTLHTPPFCWLESGIRECRSKQAWFVGVSNSVAQSWRAVTACDRIILNGIDLTRFAFAPRPQREAYLFWHGRIVPEKGLHLALQAACEVGLPLHIAGPISDPAYFASHVAPKLGAEACYLGHLSHAELAAALGGAVAFVCTPCWDEPYGLVIAEALACGVPVAAFARGAIPEILTPSCGALAHPGDVADLAVAIRQALALSRRDCRERAERHCDAAVMVDGYEALYRSILHRGAEHPESLSGRASLGTAEARLSEGCATGGNVATWGQSERTVAA